MFLGGKILTGIPLGVFLTIAPTYISEVAPPALRGPLVAAVNFSMVIGQLLGYGVMREVQAIDGPDSYRIMYAVQWGFAGVGLALIFFLPESPMRLVARGKVDMAKVSIMKLSPSDTDVDAKVGEIRAALEHNAKQSESAGGYRECFNAKNRGRTLTALSVYFFVASSGIVWVVGYMGYFMQLSGMQGIEVFDATVGVAGTMAVGAILGWFTVEKVGRRKTFILGSYNPLPILIPLLTYVIRSVHLFHLPWSNWRSHPIYQQGQISCSRPGCFYGHLGLCLPMFHW